MMRESGWFDGARHVYALRVCYAKFLRMAERLRTEMMRLLGAQRAVMTEIYGVALAVRVCAVEYLSPGRLDDVVEIRTPLIKVGGALIRLAQDPCSGSPHFAGLRLRLVCLDAVGQPARLHYPARKAVTRFETQFPPAQKERS